MDEDDENYICGEFKNNEINEDDEIMTLMKMMTVMMLTMKMTS